MVFYRRGRSRHARRSELRRSCGSSGEADQSESNRMSKSPRIPLVKPVVPGYSDLNEKLENILASGMLTKGNHLREFEEASARYLNVKHAVAVSSGTSGLMLAYRALNLQGEAIVPSFTFMATVS